MKKAITTVHTIIVILGLLATAAWSGYFLYNQRQFNSEANAKRVPVLLQQVGEALGSSNTLYDKDFGNSVKKLFSDNQDIMALTIYSYDTGIEYFYSRNGQLSIKAADAESNDQNPVYKGLSFSHNIASVPLSLKDKPGTNMDLVFTVLPRTSIFYVLRISLLAVIVLFVITLILIVAFSLSKSKETAISNDEWDENIDSDDTVALSDPASSLPDDNAFSDDLNDDLNFDASESMEESADDMDFNLPDDEALSDDFSLDSGDEADSGFDDLDIPDDDLTLATDDGLDDLSLDGLDEDIPGDDLNGLDDFDDIRESAEDDFNLDDLNLEDTIPDIPDAEDLDAMDHEESSVSDDFSFLEDEDLTSDESFDQSETGSGVSTGDGEPTLYNPETGLGWEAFLEERLGLELERSASFDQDLVLIMIRKGPTDDMEHISGKIKDAYSYHDLIFEAGSEALAMIDPNKDLDDAIENIQSLFKKLEVEEGISGLSCGLSSRNGRLITGKRLIHEADTSLNKCDDENPIVGFRSDPERFREYLSKNS